MRGLYPAVAAMFVLACSAAYAGQPSEYTLKVTPQQMALVGRALGQMPYNEVAETITALARQVNEQNDPPKAAAAPKPPPKTK